MNILNCHFLLLLAAIFVLSVSASATDEKLVIRESEFFYQPLSKQNIVQGGYNFFSSLGGVGYTNTSLTDLTIPISYARGFSDLYSAYFKTEFGGQGTTSGLFSTNYGGFGDLHLGATGIKPLSNWDIRFALDAGFSMGNARLGNPANIGTLIDMIQPVTGTSGGMSITPTVGTVYAKDSWNFGAKVSYYYRMDRKQDQSPGVTNTISGGNTIEGKLFAEAIRESSIIGASLGGQAVATCTNTTPTGSSATTMPASNYLFGFYGLYRLSENFTGLFNIDGLMIQNYSGGSQYGVITIDKISLRYIF